MVTLTHSVLAEVPIEEGDKILIEGAPPRRVILSKEETKVPNSRRAELEIEVLEAKRQATESEMESVVAQHNNGYGFEDDSVMEVVMAQLRHTRDGLGAEIAQKRLHLFDLQGL